MELITAIERFLLSETLPKGAVPVKAYSKKDLCKLYGVSHKTLTKRLSKYADEIGERAGWYYNFLQVRIIFIRLGMPVVNK